MPAQAHNVPSVGQRVPLPTERVRSSIPIGDARPAHQAGTGNTWSYPSQQMFFNAMLRKGWKPQEKEMGSVVAIHNTVNERAWRAILAWESLHAGCGRRCCDCLRPLRAAVAVRVIHHVSFVSSAGPRTSAREHGCLTWLDTSCRSTGTTGLWTAVARRYLFVVCRRFRHLTHSHRCATSLIFTTQCQQRGSRLPCTWM